MKLTHLDKLYWPEDRITKGDLLKYYSNISKTILLYLKNRPLVMRRFPDGIEGENFVQKEVGDHVPTLVKTTVVAHHDKKTRYMMVQNTQSLLYAANLGSIELHPFNSRFNALDFPDYMALDLDPVSLSFDKVVEVAQGIHEILDEIGIPQYCKTSGARGLHIYIPLHAKYDYQQIKDFGFLLANLVHQKIPQLTSLERSPSKREKKVYIDYLQNREGQTLVAAYSARGRPHATVSTPLVWDEVKVGLDPTQFTIDTIPDRLERKGDLFKPILGKGIDLKKSLNMIQKME